MAMRSKRPICVIALLCVCGSVAAAQGDRFSTYGFFDVEASASNQRGAPPWSFDVHHLNVISIYQLDSHWRVVAEVEWEHGTSLDSGALKGGVVLDRALVEYRQSDALRLLAGKFLIPFGLFNERGDATPSYVPVSLASSLYDEHPNTAGANQVLFAESGAGLQATGNAFFGSWEGTYAAYLTNGRGPTAYAQANNQAKGVGGRLVVRAPENRVQFGASFYSDRNGDAGNARQSTFALDATARFAGVLVESEGFAPRLERVDAAGAPNGAFRTGRGFYLQATRPVFDPVSLFARYDSYDPDVALTNDAQRDVALGFNFAATDAVFLKAELHFRSFQNMATPRYQQFRAAIAVAF